MVDRKISRGWLALNQDGQFAFYTNGVIDLFTLLRSDVGYVFRYHLGRVKYVVAQKVYERHDKGRFGGLFS
ncbi:hypothetical protein GCM10009087_42840 [Sphingomonas oligophenolica]